MGGHRHAAGPVDPATGATLKAYPFPGGSNSGYAGLQVLPAAMTLAGTAVPAGTLLVTNGAISPDRAYAIDPATGATLATLALGNPTAVAAVFDPGTGRLFVLGSSSSTLCVPLSFVEASSSPNEMKPSLAVTALVASPLAAASFFAFLMSWTKSIFLPGLSSSGGGRAS